MVIYKITNPIGRIYIGQAVDIKRRKRRYKYLDCKSQPLVCNSILSYGWDNHKFEVIYSFTGDRIKANELEILFIEFFNSYYYDNREVGMNLTKGGSDKSHLKEGEFIAKVKKSREGYTHSEETRKKISQANKGQVPWCVGVKFTEEHRRKISVAQKEMRKSNPIIVSEETKRKISKTMKGIVFSDEWRANIAKSARNRKKKPQTPIT